MDKKLFEQRIAPLIEYVPRCKTSKALTHQEDLLIPQSREQLVHCDNCDQMVLNPRQKIWIKNFESRYPKWAKKCLTCKKEIEIPPGKIILYK
jgi:hypothetical protein